MSPRPRRCKGKTRKGKRCRAWPLHGKDTCIAHADKETQESAGFGGSQPGAGRPRKLSATETARALVEQQVGALLTPHFRVLGYDLIDTPDGIVVKPVPGGGAKLHATYEGEVIVSRHDDLGAMINASERLMDRALGKPRQAMEHTGHHGGPIQTTTLDLRALASDDLEQLEQLLTKAAAGAGGDSPASG